MSGPSHRHRNAPAARLQRERALVCGKCGDHHPRCVAQRVLYGQRSSVADVEREGQVGRDSRDVPDHAHDRSLVARVLAHDRVAAEELTTRMRCIGRILAARNRRAAGVLRPEDLEDLCQDVAATVWSHLPAYAGIGPLEAWVHGYCDNAFRNAARRRWRERRLMQDDADPTAWPDAATEPPGLEDPLSRCLQRLSPEQQRLLHRKHHDGVSLGDLAEESGVNANTLKSQYRRALQDLRRCLGDGERR